MYLLMNDDLKIVFMEGFIIEVGFLQNSYKCKNKLRWIKASNANCDFVSSGHHLNFVMQNQFFQKDTIKIQFSRKTSLFNIIVGRLSLSSGNIKYLGKEKSSLSWKDLINIGYCPQIDSLDHSLTYEQNARIIGRIKGLTHDQINQHIEILGKYLHFEGNQQVRICDLSISERKKSNFIIALLGLPQVFIMDQTSTGVDEACSSLFLELLRSYASQMKKAVIMTSHNVKQGQKYCDRVMFFSQKLLEVLMIQQRELLFNYISSQQVFPDNRVQLFDLRRNRRNQFKTIIFEEKYRICYGFDMHKTDLMVLLRSITSFQTEGTLEQFSIYKYDLQQVAKYYMNKEQGQLRN